ncbi:CoA pyrophosphatase [Nocardioides sp.]|uniref:NUDIX hydrolase n=1 Tax=Nocardioides sp. TaxID=35761 RepID=UPI0035132B3D
MTEPTRPAPVLPDWLHPVREAAERITVHDLTRFLVPEGADPRRSAVLMLFGEGPDGPDVLLTERAHHMRSHPGQVSLPGGSLDPGETPVDAALREAWEETGLDPAGVHVFGRLPDLWLPPSNFAVTPVLGWWHAPSPISVQSPDEVHAIYRVPVAELRDPERRITVRGPGGYRSPGFLIGDRRDVILWGFTGGVISRMFTFLGWLEDAPDAPEHELPAYMLAGQPRSASRVRPPSPTGPDESEEPQGP